MFFHRKSQAEDLINCFGWGHSFITLNESLLDEYSKCRTTSDVLKCQEELIDTMNKEITIHNKQKTLTYEDIYTGLDDELNESDESENRDDDVASEETGTSECDDDDSVAEDEKDNVESEETGTSECDDDNGSSGDETEPAVDNENSENAVEVNDQMGQALSENGCEKPGVILTPNYDVDSLNISEIDLNHNKTESVRILTTDQLELLDKQKLFNLKDYEIVKLEKDAKKN